MKKPSHHRSIKSAERTLAVLELFSQLQTPLTVSRVSRELAIPQPSTSMLLRNLTELGYLHHDRESRTYTSSIRVALIGSWIGRRFSETHAVADRLDVLHKRVKETAYIAVQNGGLGQYVMMQAGPNSLNVASGNYRPLTRSEERRV